MSSLARSLLAKSSTKYIGFYCFMYLPLFVEVLCLFFVFVMHYFVSFTVLQSSLRGRERELFACGVRFADSIPFF